LLTNNLVKRPFSAINLDRIMCLGTVNGSVANTRIVFPQDIVKLSLTKERQWNQFKI